MKGYLLGAVGKDFLTAKGNTLKEMCSLSAALLYLNDISETATAMMQPSEEKS